VKLFIVCGLFFSFDSSLDLFSFYLIVGWGGADDFSFL
jgi:hypothetical protein